MTPERAHQLAKDLIGFRESLAGFVADADEAEIESLFEPLDGAIRELEAQ